nr:IS30 family transposase [Nocardiopsis sp. CNT312]
MDPPGKRHYRPHGVQARAEARRPRPKPAKICLDPNDASGSRTCQTSGGAPNRPAVGSNGTSPTARSCTCATRRSTRRSTSRAVERCAGSWPGPLPTGRARREPRCRARQRQGRFTAPMVTISERPPQVADRAAPGPGEGDLVPGQGNASAIGTPVERSTRYTMLPHLPRGRGAEQVRDALAATVRTLPRHLARSVTWDQGSEMAAHGAFTTATDIPVHLCDPASPWQRGSHGNTNGSLRQYFPKGTDLSAHSAERLAQPLEASN